MIILTVLLATVVLIFLYLCFAPFYLEINSRIGLYRIRFQHIFSIALKVKEEAIVETTVLGWKRRRALSAMPSGRKDAKRDAKPGRSGQLPVKKLLRLLSSFRVNKCYIDLDLGDMQLNGMLYPAFAWLRWHSKKSIHINFTNRNIVILEIENSLARMSRAWLGSDQ